MGQSLFYGNFVVYYLIKQFNLKKMKKCISIIAMLCILMLNVNTIRANGNALISHTTDCSCCKNCKDDKCKDLCKQWSNMSVADQKSDAGKKVKEECAKICEGMEGKGCCVKK